MNVILLTAIIFILAPVASKAFPSQPCQEKKPTDQGFINKHILSHDFDKNSPAEWKEYLEKHGLCGRVPVQSFIEKKNEENVMKICSSDGRRPVNVDPKNRNLCISTSTMTVYEVKSKTDCQIQKGDISHKDHHVIVACDKVDNKCRPVHYQRYINQKPGNNHCV